MYQLDLINQTLEALGAGHREGAISDLYAVVTAIENVKGTRGEEFDKKALALLSDVHEFCETAGVGTKDKDVEKFVTRADALLNPGVKAKASKPKAKTQARRAKAAPKATSK